GIVLRRPVPAVPDQHRAPAVFALWNGPFEGVVFDRVVLDLHRKPLLARDEARATRDRPTLHDAVEFEPKIVVQPARSVLLDHKAIALATRRAASRLGGHVELAFAAVDLQTQGFNSRAGVNSRA